VPRERSAQCARDASEVTTMPRATAACLEVAVAFGYLEAPAVAPALELVDRVCAMTYRLANR